MRKIKYPIRSFTAIGVSSRISVLFVLPSYANLVGAPTQTLLEVQTRQSNNRIEQIKENNKERIERIEKERVPNTIEETEKSNIIQNIKKQVTLDIDDTKTIRKEDLDEISQENTSRGTITESTDISLIKKY
jgi:hypothetical protein